MSTIDLSRLSAADYPELITNWKRTAKTSFCGGRINPIGTLTLSEEIGAISIEFSLGSGTLDIKLFGIGSGHFVKVSEPIESVVTDPEVAYALLVNVAEEEDEVGFVRRHKRFFTEEWKHFINLFPK